MSRRFPLFACLTGILLGAGGCFSIETTRSEVTGEQHVVIMNYGWHLFDSVPLICGNATPDGEKSGPFALFRDDVTYDVTQKRFMDHAKTLGGEITGLNYWVRENALYEIPFLSIPLPIPYILTYREIQLSGVVR